MRAGAKKSLVSTRDMSPTARQTVGQASKEDQIESHNSYAFQMGKMTLGMHIFYGSRTLKMHCIFSRSESEPVNYKLGGSRAAMAISPADFPPNPRSLNSSYRDRGSNALRQQSRARPLDGPENGREFFQLLAGSTNFCPL